ncbi:MAG: hypothetical protein H8E44_29225 [Planctomycetes bacterium]|nr:hypothetical protein [Planctomycetota bacterium]
MERCRIIGPVDQMYHHGTVCPLGNGPDDGAHVPIVRQTDGWGIVIEIAFDPRTECARVLVSVQILAARADESVQVGVLLGRAKVTRRIAGHVDVPWHHALAAAGIGHGDGAPRATMPCVEALAVALLGHGDDLASVEFSGILHGIVDETGRGVAVGKFTEAPIELQLRRCPSAATVVAGDCYAPAHVFVQHLTGAPVEGHRRLGLELEKKLIEFATVPSSEFVPHGRAFAFEQVAVIEGFDVVDAQLLLLVGSHALGQVIAERLHAVIAETSAPGEGILVAARFVALHDLGPGVHARLQVLDIAAFHGRIVHAHPQITRRTPCPLPGGNHRDTIQVDASKIRVVQTFGCLRNVRQGRRCRPAKQSSRRLNFGDEVRILDVSPLQPSYVKVGQGPERIIWIVPFGHAQRQRTHNNVTCLRRAVGQGSCLRHLTHAFCRAHIRGA